MPKIPYKGQQVDATEVDFEVRKEDWSEYQLRDGATIKMKMVVIEVLKVPDEYDNEGNPIYVIKSNNVLAVRAPDNLKKKP